MNVNPHFKIILGYLVSVCIALHASERHLSLNEIHSCTMRLVWIPPCASRLHGCNAKMQGHLLVDKLGSTGRTLFQDWTGMAEGPG